MAFSKLELPKNVKICWLLQVSAVQLSFYRIYTLHSKTVSNLHCHELFYFALKKLFCLKKVLACASPFRFIVIGLAGLLSPGHVAYSCGYNGFRFFILQL